MQKERKASRKLRRNRGISLLEVTIALCVIVVGMIALVHSLVVSMRMDQSTRETATAMSAAQSMLEIMKRDQFNTLFTTYKIGAPAHTFAVAGLNPQASGAVQGTVQFPETAGELDETIADPLYGMPLGGKDLNGDNFITVNVSANYLLLPVRITIDWVGAWGPTHYELTTYIGP